MQIRKTVVHNVSYLGRPATTIERRLQSSSTGLRIVSRQFHDEPTADVRLIHGDGRYEGFREYLREDAVSPEQLDARVAWMLSQASALHGAKARR